LEDYQLGLANGLPIYSPVDDDGRFAYSSELPVEQQMPRELIGKAILEKHGKSEANEAVLQLLRERNALVHREDYTHSYPHCWRSKTPVIFRAMDQWFIEIDHEASGSLDRARENAAKLGLPGTLSGHSFTTDDPEIIAASLKKKPKGLRSDAINTIEGEVSWIPLWGKNRILG